MKENPFVYIPILVLVKSWLGIKCLHIELIDQCDVSAGVGSKNVSGPTDWYNVKT